MIVFLINESFPCFLLMIVWAAMLLLFLLPPDPAKLSHFWLAKILLSINQPADNKAANQYQATWMQIGQKRVLIVNMCPTSVLKCKLMQKKAAKRLPTFSFIMPWYIPIILIHLDIYFYYLDTSWYIFLLTWYFSTCLVMFQPGG